MGFKCGIVGLPNVGKSTLFNALTQTAAAQAANYPFCTIEPNVGDVAVPDPRLDVLAKIAGSQQIIPTRLTFVDIAGLVRGASKGEGLGNQFLANIRETDAICEVVRYFTDEDIIHVEGKVNPESDVEKRVDAARYVDDVRVAEVAHDLCDRIGVADVGEELVAEPLALTGSAHQPRDVDELHGRGHDALRMHDLREAIEPRVRHRDDADVWLDRGERVVGRVDLLARERDEERGLPHVGQTDDADRQRHAHSLRGRRLARLRGGPAAV